MDLDPGVLGADHYKDQHAESYTRALVIMGPSVELTSILELHYALYPAPFPVEFFTTEQEATAWAQDRMSK